MPVTEIIFQGFPYYVEAEENFGWDFHPDKQTIIAELKETNPDIRFYTLREKEEIMGKRIGTVKFRAYVYTLDGKNAIELKF